MCKSPDSGKKEQGQRTATVMNKKYELTDETKMSRTGTVLHRIRAVKSFTNSHGEEVHAGDLGGWIENEYNLFQTGNSWVCGEAKVFGSARVLGEALIYGSAEVFNSAQVYDAAHVGDDARVFGSAHICGNARVCGSSEVYGSASVCDEALVYGNAKVYENAGVCGVAEVCGYAAVYGNARIYGDARVFGNADVYGEAIVSGDAKVKGSLDYAVFKNTWSSGRFFTYTRSNKMWTVGCFHGTGEVLIAKAYKDSELSGKCYEAIVRVQEAIDKAMEHSSKHIEEEGRQ